MMANKVYRYRRCPKCLGIFPAGQLKIVNYHGNHYHTRGGSLRRCPKCGKVAFTQDFKEIDRLGYLFNEQFNELKGGE